MSNKFDSDSVNINNITLIEPTEDVEPQEIEESVIEIVESTPIHKV